ncbi:MAG: sulfurtransferase [Gammaproteobacteria bacterium]|nr:sulfurtransferase [Gammaproteobacteria bacterium]NIR99023.1 sulfurtransferase [Gammaproteobacteria bacterium]NIT64649.1 sulfurtransferase [Gammaproteobacteria bacterium]NIV21622.1 sulfurtransferase [Gammaproteobacteria bacterium]NIY33229.1 sulfurtransferase [Gammaproteobacteria bacterium]
MTTSNRRLDGRTYARLALLLILAVGIGLAVAYRGRFDAAALEAWVHGSGAAAPLLFVAIYAVAAVLFLPGSVVTLAGGALFGPVLGTLYNLTGATLGATLAFLLARYLGADWVERKTGGRLKQLKDGVESEGWRFVAFVRLVPLFPFNVLNYALGLTRVSLIHYVVASFVFMSPGAVAYTYLGYAGREAVAGGEGLIQKILLALALLAVVAFLPRLVARLRQKPMLEVATLKQRLDAGDDVLVLDVRSAEEYAGEQGHVPASRNVPVEQLPARLAELGDYQERPVALVCRTDRRSTKAAQILAGNGFGDVHVVRGGMTAWNERGYPVEGAAAPGGGRP